MPEIYTIGYSSYTIQSFTETLISRRITAVADVRSSPYSNFHPQFNRDDLRMFLKENGIAYVFLGDECGARPKDKDCYINDKISFGLIIQSSNFLKGIERLKNGMRKYRIALMCAEKDPINCHRMILIANYLAQFGISVNHILDNGIIETHKQTEERLLKEFKLYEEELPGLARSKQDRLQDAYKKQESKIAYQEQDGMQEKNE